MKVLRVKKDDKMVPASKEAKCPGCESLMLVDWEDLTPNKMFYQCPICTKLNRIEM